ncbi:DUF2004 domain-containing protein [Aureibaculum sp. A20]|uniref:DUF2004 domain-containing protein n=1 Tax=Aureibaculum flavum TaxID=2795986 RepID=A0ABS0WWZ7_9FLAO|nr:DUF2004 domain-containing protein [Aureibaculum flavum]MBJ2176483.1 DUF2004 domain-containing protein [Aureibaculum flavum]
MKKPTMTQTLLFILVIGIGLFYALKYGNKAKKDIAEFESKKETNTTTKEIIELKYFGEIDLNKTEEYIDVLTNINGNEISIDLNIIEETISKKTIQPTINFLENLHEIEKIAHKQVLSDFKNGNIVKDYIEHHIGEFNDDDLKSLGIKTTDSPKERKQKFLNKIYLKRIGFYPEEWDSLAIFDFTISRDLTQYLIVLSFDSNGKFVDIYTES